LRVAAFWIAAIGIFMGAGMLRAAAPPAYSALAWGALGTIGVVALTIAFLRRERRGADSAGLRLTAGSLPRFLAGAFLGVALYALQVALVAMITGSLRLAPTGRTAGAIALAVAIYVALAAMEEVAFRGYPLRRLEERFGAPAAIAIGAMAFGILHLIYGWPPWMALVGATGGGVLFGAAALATRGLAVPIGLHSAWNVGSWAVGEKDGAGIWRIVASGADSARVSQVGTLSYLLVMAVGTAGFVWFARYRRRQVLSAAAIGGERSVPPAAP
jgi:membrane protease YdiL (CAAX protease family)